MKKLKLFEDHYTHINSITSDITSDIKDIFIDLVDSGLVVKMSTSVSYRQLLTIRIRNIRGIDQFGFDCQMLFDVTRDIIDSILRLTRYLQTKGIKNTIRVRIIDIYGVERFADVTDEGIFINKVNYSLRKFDNIKIDRVIGIYIEIKTLTYIDPLI